MNYRFNFSLIDFSKKLMERYLLFVDRKQREDSSYKPYLHKDAIIHVHLLSAYVFNGRLNQIDDDIGYITNVDLFKWATDMPKICNPIYEKDRFNLELAEVTLEFIKELQASYNKRNDDIFFILT